MAFSSCLTRKRHTLCARGPPAGRGGKASCVQALQEDALHRQARGICHSRSEFVRLRWPFPSACQGKGLFRKKLSQVSPKRFRSGLGPSQVSPRRCRSALGLPRLWKFPSLSTSFCFPSDFGELPKSDNPGFRNRIIRVLAMDFARACDGRLSRNARNGI